MSYYPGLKAALAGIATAQSTANSALSLVQGVLSAQSSTFSMERLLAVYAPSEANAAYQLGMSGIVATGTGTTPTMAATNLITQRRRVTFTSANAASRWGGFRSGTTSAKVFRGSVAGHGGFRFRAVFGTTSAVSTQSLLVGLVVAGTNPFVDTTALTFSNLTDCVFVGYDPAGAQLVIMHNDAASTCTQVALNGGTGFPVDNSTLYQITITALPNASDIQYELVNITTGLTVSGSILTNLPTNTALMYPACGAGTNSGGGIAIFELGSMVLQTYNY